MGYKLKDGENNYLPASFLKEFVRYNYVPPGIDRSKDDVLNSIEKARMVFVRHKVKVRQGSSVDQLLSRAEREIRKSSGIPARASDLQYVIALTGLLIGLADEKGLSIPLERIAKSNMETSCIKPSQGKDAVWELSCMSTFQIGAMQTRLAEPDIVIDIGEGDYGVACKKVYSENSVEKCIAKGVKQIADAQMPGFIALNVDELLIPPRRSMYALDQETLRGILQGYAGDFITRHLSTLQKYGQEGACDGFIVSATKVGWLLTTRQWVQVTVNLHAPMQSETALGSVRLDKLGRLAANADGLEAWVAKVGGKAVGL
ncbi:hypothetical protein GIW45_26135 [Pseudomonas congelans]|uniref:hypothetical protein n=1 Tax=Pseudomonas congelans TaxID=200452 RepID=UPI001F1EBC82|nr:hypothetical protein [Pseudomonas congelans]MCF5167426.1 hypothetical protein [Pseudomonas congelans]